MTDKNPYSYARRFITDAIAVVSAISISLAIMNAIGLITLHWPHWITVL